MKLTCMIIAVLFLMACQLITADYPRDKQENHAVRLRDMIRNSRSREHRSCRNDGESCPSNMRCCPGLKCCGFKGGACMPSDPGC